MLIELGAVLVALTFVLYLFLTWNFNYWKKYGIPYEKPKFFFGNFKEALIGEKHFGLIYQDLYKKFNNAAYFGFFKLGTPSLVIRDLDLTKAVLVKDYNHFAENDFHTDTEKDAILAENPFFRSGEMWKIKRARWSIVLTPTKVKGIYGTMEEKSQRMVEYLQEHIRDHPGEPMEARGLAVKYLTDVVVSGVMGLQINTFVDEENIFKKLALSFFVSDFWEGLSNFAYIIAPWIHTYFSTGFLKQWVKDECLDIARNIVALKKKNGYTNNDFFESMMKESDSTEVDVAGRVLGFLSEGVETSSGLISFSLYEMAANPQIQAKLRKELNDVAAANNGQLSYDNIQNIHYLDMVMKETMRVYPGVLTLNRVCTIPYTLPPAVPGGKPFTIPVGMPVTICNYATHHDPQYFPSPEVFDPERFQNEDNITKYSYLPFGEGPRICIGMRLGLTNSKVALSAILRNFEVRVSPKTAPKPLPIDPTVFITRTVGDLWVTFHKISS